MAHPSSISNNNGTISRRMFYDSLDTILGGDGVPSFASSSSSASAGSSSGSSSLSASLGGNNSTSRKRKKFDQLSQKEKEDLSILCRKKQRNTTSRNRVNSLSTSTLPSRVTTSERVEDFYDSSSDSILENPILNFNINTLFDDHDDPEMGLPQLSTADDRLDDELVPGDDVFERGARAAALSFPPDHTTITPPTETETETETSSNMRNESFNDLHNLQRADYYLRLLVQARLDNSTSNDNNNNNSSNNTNSNSIEHASRESSRNLQRIWQSNRASDERMVRLSYYISRHNSLFRSRQHHFRSIRPSSYTTWIGATPSKIESKTLVCKHRKQDPEITCVVCCCNVEVDDQVRRLPCMHAFHKNCVDSWLSRNSICPVCKHRV